MSSKRVEEEYKDVVASNSWYQVYKTLGTKCQTYPYTCVEAKKIKNKGLNRYRDVNPYDHSRVVLKRCNTDYINANLVKIERANRQYILTQGPLLSTVTHFWSMVWEENSRAIIMLNKIMEKHEMKCHWYWPYAGGDQSKLSLEDINLIVKQVEEMDYEYFTTRLFEVTDTLTKEKRMVTHFHYTTWPDFEVPSSPVALLEFLDQVRASGALEPDVGPAIVHCSAGIGRSGTFCLVDTTLLLIERDGQENVDIIEILLEMRKYRMGLVQTSEQLRFSYQAIIEGIKRKDPNYTAPMEESIYSPVAEDEEAPPPPPPRGESLGSPPARPLPAIPTSTSLGHFGPQAELDSTDSDDDAPTPPFAKSPMTLMKKTPSPIMFSSAEEDEKKLLLRISSEDNGDAEVRRRKQRELAERVASMRKRAHDADRWHSLKRSLYTPIAISVGFLLAGILIYSYVKH